MSDPSKSDLYDYLVWLEVVTQPKFVLGSQFVVVSSGNIPCYGTTYPEAVEAAFDQDRTIFEATKSIITPSILSP